MYPLRSPEEACCQCGARGSGGDACQIRKIRCHERSDAGMTLQSQAIREEFGCLLHLSLVEVDEPQNHQGAADAAPIGQLLMYLIDKSGRYQMGVQEAPR